MVDVRHPYNFSGIIDEFFALKPPHGPHAKLLRQLVEERVGTIMDHKDVRYMPAFKILDLIADMVNSATALDAEPQLRETEARVLLRNGLSDEAPRVRQFLLDAALERARYEPMMIMGATVTGDNLRDLTLRKRWQAMKTAHQALHPLPPAWLSIVDAAVDAVIIAPCFTNFRIGPLMQCFAEMLETARRLFEKQAPPETLIAALAEGSPLWKRYALKAGRYRTKKQQFYGSETHRTRPTIH